MNYACYNSKPPIYGKEMNGEIPTLNPNTMTVNDIYRTPFLFLQEHKKNYKNLSSTALKSIQFDSYLSKLFFSDENMKRIQHKIKDEIYKRTNGQFRIDVDQDKNDLLVTMRAIYLEQSRFLPGQVVRQVKRLNEKVITEIVPDMITQIKQEYDYLKEINKPLSPIPRPVNVNNAGRKTLPSVTTTFGF